MTKTISASEMVRHIENLSAALAIFEKPLSTRTPEDYGTVRGHVSYTRDCLLRAVAQDVDVQTKDTLREVRELIEGYVDIKDGPEGAQLPNNAMRATQLIDEALS